MISQAVRLGRDVRIELTNLDGCTVGDESPIDPCVKIEPNVVRITYGREDQG
jgi:hypothetical protein